ncbi:MAG TPA: SusC/RagA family TonB-linked outer membrane protein, partial [Chitinophagaceae bacterium]
EVQVSGTVTDAVTKKGLAGIRLKVDNFSAAITDSTGGFSLKVPSYTATIIVEGEGYNSQRIPLKGRRSLTIRLIDESHESFNETVTLPFGPKIKTEVTAATGQYNVNSAWAQPLEMPDAILQGRVAGLNVIRRSGAQGVGANMFLRGYNSLYATNKPLIIIDNMLFDANEYGESIIANNYTNPLALIDVKDIENITVLKDASSTYGTKGANGAIIITTARAKTQATRIDFALYGGVNQKPDNLPVMNAADYRIYLHEILLSKGMSIAQIQEQPYMNDDPQNPLYAKYHFDTDWQDKVMENGINQNYFLKVTGGDNIATYGLAMGFTKNDGIIKQTDITRYNTRFNAEFNFTKRFTGTTNLSFTYNEQNLKDQGIADKTAPLFLALTKAPFLNDRDVNEKGIESPNLSELDLLGVSNPSTVIEKMEAANKYYRFFGSFGFQYEISSNFKASTLIGVVFDKMRETFFVPRKGIADDTLSNAVADSRMGTQVKRLFTIYNDTRVEFRKIYGGVHNVAARMGVRYQKNESEQDFALGFNSATDDLMSVQNGVNALRQVGGGIGDWNWLNLYLNTDYGFRDKFFLNLNVAMDGSSRFGVQAENGITIAGHKFPVMPSIGAAWLISSEEFMANSPFDLLKLRTSYSITGNDDIGNYNSGHTYVSQNLLGAQGLIRKGVANPALQWETVRKLNLGVDLAFWNERLNVTVDVYKNTTDNMLVYEPLPPISGFEYTITNGGKLQNTGIELSLNVRVVNKSNFRWDAGFNVATNKNKILEVPNGKILTEYAGATILTETGSPATQFYGYQTNGVFATDAAASGLRIRNADSSFTTFKGGDVQFVDRDGNKIIDENDRTVIGSAIPRFIGGFNNRVVWKRFEFNALITFSQGGDVYNYLRRRLESVSGIENQLVSVNNRWRGPGQVTTMPKAAWGDPMGNSRFSDRWIEDGSYVRLRSISLQYSVPVKETAVLRNLTIYATATNLFTLTKYKGYDPEFSVTPSVFSQGIDTGLDPLYRSVTVGIRLGL